MSGSIQMQGRFCGYCAAKQPRVSHQAVGHTCVLCGIEYRRDMTGNLVAEWDGRPRPIKAKRYGDGFRCPLAGCGSVQLVDSDRRDVLRCPCCKRLFPIVRVDNGNPASQLGSPAEVGFPPSRGITVFCDCGRKHYGVVSARRCKACGTLIVNSGRCNYVSLTLASAPER